MTIGRRAVLGLALVPWMGTAVRAECLGDCGFGAFFAVAIGGPVVLGLIAFVMVKFGFGWLIKWIVGVALGAGFLIAAVPSLIVDFQHDRTAREYGRLDIAGPLPRMADRTPVVLFDGHLSNCEEKLERYVTVWAKEGVLAVELRSVEGVDFGNPVALADLPLELHVGDQGAEYDADYDGRYRGLSYQVRKLKPEEKQAAAAEIDYVILAQCSGDGETFKAFRGNPALQGTVASYEVVLAMAPLKRGSGVLSIRDLQFDFLDLYFRVITRGFLFAYTKHGYSIDPPYDPALLEAALCTRKDGTMMPDCAG